MMTDVKGHLAEPVLNAGVQNRLSVPSAVGFMSKLAARTKLRVRYLVDIVFLVTNGMTVACRLESTLAEHTA